MILSNQPGILEKNKVYSEIRFLVLAMSKKEQT